MTVGAGGKLAFVPSTITAAIGDTVVFSYYPSSHSVAEGVFPSACTPATDGFFSGLFSTTAAEVINPNIFTITIDTLDPTVFYCSSGKHCASGMVGVINPKYVMGDGEYKVGQMKTSANLSSARPLQRLCTLPLLLERLRRHLLPLVAVSSVQHKLVLIRLK